MTDKTEANTTESSAAQASQVERLVMYFEMRHKIFNDSYEKFYDFDAPDWLTSTNTVKGSIRDHRWC